MNDGAFRGIVLVAVAVAIGLILLGSGLDDTSSTARVDASDSSGDDNGSSDDPDEGSGDDAVGSPLSPSEINVIVANGAGVEGAAATISATLTDLGYVPLPATNTVVPTSETPLDTVYYATSPNTQAQAEQVAEDLGISPSAVLAYPGQETAPAPMGLAQVLVVLGSSENQLATGGGGGSATTAPPG